MIFISAVQKLSNLHIKTIDFARTYLKIDLHWIRTIEKLRDKKTHLIRLCAREHIGLFGWLITALRTNNQQIINLIYIHTRTRTHNCAIQRQKAQ